VFCVLAPIKNKALLRNNILLRFKQLLKVPDSFNFIDLDDIINAIRENDSVHGSWAIELSNRYSGI